MIIIGLGTGRSGTNSLASLLDAQRDSVCFHEMLPHPVRFGGTPRPILNMVDEFQAILGGGDPSLLTAGLSNRHTAATYDRLCAMQNVRMIGDVALYYLPYVETIATYNHDVRFICTRRDIEETVRSYMEKTRVAAWRSKFLADYVHSLILREPFRPTRNHWMDHDGTRWREDFLWDKCYPKFEAKSRQEAITKYCEYYYAEAEKLAAKLGERFRFVDMSDLNDRSRQAQILDFAGIPPAEQKFPDVHENRSVWR